MKQPGYRQGMTLVEVLIAVAIIGLLAILIVPAVNLAIRGRQNAECARKLHAAIEAFELYAAETGGYPANKNSGETPPEMVDYYFPYFKIDWWGDITELGGHWDWDNGYHFKYSVSIAAPTKSPAQMEDFDKLVDDGNLDTGNFRNVGTQYHYIIED